MSIEGINIGHLSNDGKFDSGLVPGFYKFSEDLYA